MNKIFFFGAAIVIATICIYCGSVYCQLDYNAHCIYKNYTANVTEHYDKEYTTLTTVSTGKGMMTIPIYHHDYYIVADNQTMSVSSSFWHKINDTIQLTKNLNTSEVKINYDYYEA